MVDIWLFWQSYVYIYIYTYDHLCTYIYIYMYLVQGFFHQPYDLSIVFATSETMDFSHLSGLVKGFAFR